MGPVTKSITLCVLLTGIITPERATAEKIYKNPVSVETFSSPAMGMMGIGDPSIISFEGKYYLYPTGDNYSYDVYSSSDLIHWEKGPKVFRSAESGAWAPDVFYNSSDRKFYLYYTVHHRIGVAVADWPGGTFADLGVLVNNAIDAHMFLDEDDKYYLYYVQFPEFTICVQPMETPVHKKGEPLKIIQPITLWERKNGPVTGAPWVVKHKGIYYLLYSGGGPDTRDYEIGYAISQSPIGPFVKYSGNPS